MLLLDLNGKWKMKRTDHIDWIDATVPGSVYNDLLNAGLMEDPFYRDNEYKALELSNYNYEYQRSFIISREQLAYDQLLLHCDGLDTICEISINSKSVMSTINMHRTYEVDIRSFVLEGENRIRILFKSPVEYVLRRQNELPLINSSHAVPGISHLRKAHCMFGWDWGPKLPDMGIWRSINIQGFHLARLDEVYITQKHKSKEVSLNLRIGLEKWKDSGLDVSIEVTSPDGITFKKSVSTLNCLENIELSIQNPQLWWPNNFGPQPLYGVKISLLKGGMLIDCKSMNIGLRTVSIKRERDNWGESFAFEVNGVSIFSMGADYVPEDNILARCSRDKTEKLIKSCANANFNTIRVWGGGFYPEDYFYDLCDEYGLIVWQDLMYACGIYDLNDEFKENIIQETIDNIKRIRHHASLGLWCGNNEQEIGWAEWGWSQSCSPKHKADYIKQFEVLLPEIAKATDPNTFYWLASPSSTGSFDKPNSEDFGDMHYWGVWHAKEPFTAYRTIFPRYMSEFGIQSFPTLKTIHTFTLPEDRNIFSHVMESHQKNGTGNEKIMYYISDNYKYPKNFSSLLYSSQLNQAEGLRYGVEHWRRNRGRCMGAVYWQLNDCWPVASWASIDYFGRWKALHYSAKKFFAPIIASACEDGTKVSLHVSNETMKEFSGNLSWRLMDSRSSVMMESGKAVTVAALSSSACDVLDFSDILDTMEKMRTSYFEFKLEADGKVISTGTVLFVKSKHFGYIDPKIRVRVSETDDLYMIELTAGAYAKFVELDLKDSDALFEDNYFDLSAGDTRRIEVMKSSLSDSLPLEEFTSQLVIRSVYDTYEKW